MDYQTITLSVNDGLATLTLNRPEQANAMNPLMAKELSAAATYLAEVNDLRCVLLQSTGKLFCAGGDISEFAASGSDVGRLIRTMAGDLHVAISRLTRLDAPIVCAVQGTAAGAGSVFARRLIWWLRSIPRNSLSLYQSRVISRWEFHLLLPRRIGDRRARELMLTNRVLSAAEAESWGLVNQVVPEDQLTEATSALVSMMTAGPTRAFGAVKRLLNESSHTSLETQMELETRESLAAR